MIRSARLAVAWSLPGVLALGCADALGPNTEIGLRVWGEVSPSVVRISDTVAVVRIRIHAENPSAEEIRIRSGGPPYILAGDTPQGRGFAEGYRLAHSNNPFTAGPTMDWGWDTVYVFKPHRAEYAEAELRLRDWNRDGTPADTGVYKVRSFFNGREGASATFRIEP